MVSNLMPDNLSTKNCICVAKNFRNIEQVYRQNTSSNIKLSRNFIEFILFCAANIASRIKCFQSVTPDSKVCPSTNK